MFGELLAGAKKTRQQKIKLTPQFAQVIFQWRPGQTQSMPGRDLPHRLGTAAGNILYRLCLIKDEQMVIVLHQAIDVPPEQGIGRQHHIMCTDIAESFLAPRPMQRQHTQVRRKAFCFTLPVENQRGRQHDQRRPVEPPLFLFQQQMGQRLRRLAQTHVVGKDAGQILCTQELQPGQPFFLVSTQLQLQAAWWRNVADPLRRLQTLRQRQHILLPTEIPAAGIGQLCQARCIEARQAQGFATGEAIEQIDQRRRQRLDPPGRNFQLLPLRRQQDDRLVVGNIAQVDTVQPARIAPEQHGQQGRQRQALSFDHHPHVEIEPAVTAFRQFGIPTFDFNDVMAEIISKIDVPARNPQIFHAVLHELRPRGLVGQPENLLRRRTKSIQNVGRQRQETRLLDRLQGLRLFRRAPHQSHSLTFWQRHEAGFCPGGDVDFTVAKIDLCIIKGTAAIAVRIIAPRTVAVGLQGAQMETGLQRYIDLAQTLAGILHRQGHARRQLGQCLGHQRGFLFRQRRQIEQTLDQAGLCLDLQRPDLPLLHIDIPGRRGRQHQLTGRFRTQVWPLESLPIDHPAKTSRSPRPLP